jgi:hypothetical protein
MLRRLLNIASIVCLVLCVALMGMWIRSYRWRDEIQGHFTNRQSFTVASLPGRLGILIVDMSSLSPWTIHSEQYGSKYQPGRPTASLQWKHPIVMSHYVLSKSEAWLPSFSYWFLVLTSGSLAMLFQLRWPWRFRLRSLFIVTTFLAVLLGMIAGLDH